MLDIKFIRENPDLIKEAIKKKHLEVDLDDLLKTDDKRRELLTEVEEMRAKQNQVSQKVAALQSPERETMVGQMRELKDKMQEKEKELTAILTRWRELMLQVPNVPDISVPEGVSEEEDQEVRVWGKPPKFNFTPKNHLELMQALDLVDFERGAKVSGFRGYFLKNAGAKLSLAIWQYALNKIEKKGFTPMLVPSLVRRECLLGTGYLPQGEEDLYKTQDKMYLAGTSEVSMMGYFADEILDPVSLPQKIVAFSPCFRREAGAHGKDTKGLIRVHEFFKVEQVVLCEAGHQESVRLHEEITANAEEMLQELGLPYRVMALCGGDLGLPHVKTYDIEVWIPSEKRYRETHSASYYHDFQSRRLNIRYRDKQNKLRFAHSLNNTALATPRLLAAIIENFQQVDSSVAVPEALVSYLGQKVLSHVHGNGEEKTVR